jgi:hypothetical protein
VDKEFLDPKDVKKQEEAEAKFNRERKLRISDLRKILSTPEGRRFVWNELSRTKVFAPSFSLNSSQTSYNEGERSVGIALLADVMEAKPEAFYQSYCKANSKEKAVKTQEESNDGTNQSD